MNQMSLRLWVAALLFSTPVCFAADPTAPATPAQPAAAANEGRLGGGYKEAKWGMTVAKVKTAVPSKLEFESKQPGLVKFLTYDLGEGRKVSLNFDQDGFYRAVYHPLTNDGDTKTAEAVLAGLNKKYGAGEIMEGYEDAAKRPLRIVEWTDGVTRISFRMPDTKSEAWEKPPFARTLMSVTYTSIEIEAKQAKRKEEALKLEKEKKQDTKKDALEDDL